MQPQTKDDATTKIKARRTRGFKPQAEANSSSKGSVGHACETGKPQQDSSPNLPKPSPVKVPNVAFWRPKETERWCNANTNKRWCNHQDQGPKNAIFRQKNCLTSLSEKKMELDHGKIKRWNRTSLTPLARSPWSGGVGGYLEMYPWCKESFKQIFGNQVRCLPETN